MPFDLTPNEQILLDRTRTGQSRHPCPWCSGSRKNKTETCLSVNRDDERIVYSCHHCGVDGIIVMRETHRSHEKLKPREEKKIERRKREDFNNLDDRHLAWLSERGISASTAQKYDLIGEEINGVPVVSFPYYDKDGNVVAAKRRFTNEKKFLCWQTPESFFGIKQLKKGDNLYVVEGECFTGETQILTRSGWVKFSDLGDEEVAQVFDNGKIEFVRPTAKIVKPYAGELVSNTVKGYSSLTTPNHNLVSIDYRGRWYKHPATSPRSITHMVPRVGILNGPGIPLTDDQIALCIAISADVSIDVRTDGSRYGRCALKKQRKIDRLRGLVSRLGISVSDNVISNGYTSICFRIPEWVPGRMLDWSWVADSTIKQREFILAEMVHWDGNSVPNREQTEYSSRHYENALFMQSIAHTSGRCSTIINRENKYGSWYKVSILHGKTTSSWQTMKTERINYLGTVYCVSVPSGMILVRHDGYISVSGNCDVLALAEIGIRAVSVPNGAPMKVTEGKIDPSEDGKFKFLWDAKEYIDAAERIFIATDQDGPGEALAEEIARRVGKGKSWRIKFPEGIKDSNDCLVKCGTAALKRATEAAQPWPVQGLYDAEHFRDLVWELYEKGAGKGESTGYSAVDEFYTIVPGQVTICTGIPSSGKSEFIDQVMVNLASDKGWRLGICSFENEPRLHIAKLMSKRAKMHFFEGPTRRMSNEEYKAAFNWVQEHFAFVWQDDGSLADLDSILDRLRVAILRYGIRGAVIDPYNFISRDSRDKSETEWISDMLTKVKAFAMGHGVHIWFVAHPTKLQRGTDGKVPVPGGYDISGSAAWFAKADCGLTVHREKDDPLTAQIHVWKCRFSWVGKQGSTNLLYNPATTCYVEPVGTEEGGFEL